MVRPYRGHPPACTCVDCQRRRSERGLGSSNPPRRSDPPAESGAPPKPPVRGKGTQPADSDDDDDRDLVTCPTCEGRGEILGHWRRPEGDETIRCPTCFRKGKIPKDHPLLRRPPSRERSERPEKEPPGPSSGQGPGAPSGGGSRPTTAQESPPGEVDESVRRAYRQYRLRKWRRRISRAVKVAALILVLVAIASPVLWHYSNGAEWLDALSMTREDIHVVVDCPTKPAIVKDFVLRNESVPLGEGFPGYSDAALAAMICRGEYRSIFETLPPANETPQPAPPTATPLPTGIVQDGDGTPTLPATRTPFATRIPASIPTARQIPPAAESATVISTPSESVAPRIRFDSSFETVYYLVSGTTTSAIFDSVESQGPDYEQKTAETVYCTQARVRLF